MSTRCQIAFYENKDQSILKPSILLYRHCDGYPGTVDGKEYGVLCDIVPFLRDFKKHRGLDDIEYCAAWLIHELIEKHIKMIRKLHKNDTKQQKKVFKRFSHYVGHGICEDFHGDIEYVYRIYSNTLEVYKIVHSEQELKNYCSSPYKESNFSLIETIDL